jgi:HTH-type transcriptional regulator/antitoxin MqsA
MRCVFCGGTVEKKMVTFIYDEDDRYVVVENVPAEQCTKCGEKTYSPEVTDELLKFAKDDVKPEKFIRIPVHDFAAKPV